MIKIAICDDERAEITYLTALVRKWAAAQGVIVRLSDYESAESFLFACGDNKTVDILLLDIQMKVMDGLELARQIRRDNEIVQIIFITGYPDFIAEGYDVSALHYLMKPVKENKLIEVLDKAVKNLENESEQILAVTINRDDIFIPFRDIIYIESSLHYININTEKDQYKVKMPLTEIENKLGGGFFKCTRSFIVGLRYVRRISKNEVILKNGVTIPLGRGLYKDINKAFIKYF